MAHVAKSTGGNVLTQTARLAFLNLPPSARILIQTTKRWPEATHNCSEVIVALLADDRDCRRLMFDESVITKHKT